MAATKTERVNITVGPRAVVALSRILDIGITVEAKAKAQLLEGVLFTTLKRGASPLSNALYSPTIGILMPFSLAKCLASS